MRSQKSQVRSQKSQKGLLAAGVLLAVATLGAQSAAPAKPATAPSAPAGKVENGGVLYKKIGCYQCHGGEGQGGLSGPRIGPALFPYARFSDYIRKPTGDMPPYSAKVLTDQEIADIYAWVNARPRPPAVNTLPQLAP
jgi:ubiquinol-cytochrome c reductase cytochrome c subunit